MLLNTGKKCVYSKKGLLTTLGCDAKGKPVFVLEGAVFIAGAVIQWLRDELKMIKDSSATESMIAGLVDTNGVYLVPAFVGLGAPYWKADARGIITGLTRGANARLCTLRSQRHTHESAPPQPLVKISRLDWLAKDRPRRATAGDNGASTGAESRSNSQVVAFGSVAGVS